MTANNGNNEVVHKSDLNPKQKAFVEFYLQSGNALQSALKAGYSENYAKTQSSRMLVRPAVQKAIATRMESIDSERIAKTNEILEYLTSVMRGTQEDEMAMNIGKGNGITAAEKIQLRVCSKDRLKAAEMLAKINGMFVSKAEMELTGVIPVVIQDDV